MFIPLVIFVLLWSSHCFNRPSKLSLYCFVLTTCVYMIVFVIVPNSRLLFHDLHLIFCVDCFNTPLCFCLSIFSLIPSCYTSGLYSDWLPDYILIDITVFFSYHFLLPILKKSLLLCQVKRLSLWGYFGFTLFNFSLGMVLYIVFTFCVFFFP